MIKLLDTSKDNMNDKIKELARLAHEDALKEYRLRMESELASDVIFADIYDRNFAELIVLECAEICEEYGMPDGTSPVAAILSESIKNKFGV